jgi:lipoyl(octanoyl) transferase
VRTCLQIDLGLIGYQQAWALQKRIVAARKTNLLPDVLLLGEHPHVITSGRNGKREHLLAPDAVLQQMKVEFCPTDRGGDVTYHGPGQIVGYPILHLAEIRRDVVWYVRQLEEVMIRATQEYGITAGREPGKTGVWVKTARGEEKLAAIGVHLSRWVTSHGFAYNVSTDLRYFDLIVPCGISGKKATSLERLLGRAVERGEAAGKLARRFGEVFGLEMRSVACAELLARLAEAEQPRSAGLAVPA